MLRALQSCKADEVILCLVQARVLSNWLGGKYSFHPYNTNCSLSLLGKATETWLHQSAQLNDLNETIKSTAEFAVNHWSKRQIKRFVLAMNRHKEIQPALAKAIAVYRAEKRQKAQKKKQKALDQKREKAIARGLKANGYKPEKDGDVTEQLLG
jgi:hypothetical protein